MTKNIKKAIVVGAGIGGLATAIRLQSSGFAVTVFESNTYFGGKLTAFEESGYRFDMGPSLFTMPQFIEDLFKTADRNIEDYFQYQKKETVCNYFYEDGTRFSAKADVKQFAENAEKAFNVDEVAIINYLERSKKKYDLTASLFLEKSLHKFQTYLSKDTIKAIFQINSLDINTTLHAYNAAVFKDDKLVQLFDRFATYNGSSPYQTPGIMSMIPHLEQYFGTYFPKGGMHSITQSMYKLAEDIGVKFQFNTLVTEILVENKTAIGILENGNKHFADVVISNADVVPTYRKLLSKQKAPEKTLQQPRSSSALIFYWGITKEFPDLDLHNIFFSEDYKTEFDYIFNKKDVFEDPTIYVNITSKEEKTDAPKGNENWFVMVNVPSNTGQNWDEIIQKTKKNIIAKLSRVLNVDFQNLINFESVLDPRKIESNTQSYQGALYGASSNNKFAAFLRHPNFSQHIKNLYFCGGSVHPGGGIPLCLLSGKIVSELILND
ncbi:1-hydroxycarotenoid 3,4-desaturase CrtD [uncultured Polaribacter sp.]|uniref:1-hydroxycarotenoid 3,4-desaturase CrtD n=1 Tax=uncultured Polaribacter sp. TaxID=174711 RepID=UPI002629C36B|nr:1-hydroxycarotenoid 3,4-desaturase CrtD [uncultured Polaribacter sp.]